MSRHKYSVMISIEATPNRKSLKVCLVSHSRYTCTQNRFCLLWFYADRNWVLTPNSLKSPPRTIGDRSTVTALVEKGSESHKPACTEGAYGRLQKGFFSGAFWQHLKVWRLRVCIL